MSYPDWLPRPKSWFQAIVLLLCTTPIALITRMLGEMMFNLFEVGLRAGDWRLWVGIAGTIIPTVWTLAHVYQFLWGEPNQKYPKWLPSLRSWGEGFYSWLTFWICFAIILLITAIELDARGALTMYGLSEYLEERGGAFTLIFVIGSAYLYHAKTLITKRFDPKRFRPTKKP